MKVSKIIQRMLEIQSYHGFNYAQTPKEIITTLERLPKECLDSKIIACDVCKIMTIAV